MVLMLLVLVLSAVTGRVAPRRDFKAMEERRMQAARLPKLTKAQLRQVDRELRKGPLAHGYDTELWTLARVAGVIEALTGVRYHPGHVWRILKQLGWSRQRPARRAVERDEDAIVAWRATECPG